MSLFWIIGILSYHFLISSGTAKVLATTTIIDPEELVEVTALPTAVSYEGWVDWDTWEASPDVVQSFPYCRAGYDLDGLVVYITEFGKWNYRDWVLKPKEKQDEFWKYFEQFVMRHEFDGQRNNGQGIAVIMDWEGFTLGNYASEEALSLGLKMFTETVRVNNALKYGYMVNTNYAAETFINLARPFLGTMMEKYEVFGTRPQKWQHRILRSIPPSALPARYGGNETEWTPLSIHATEE